MNTELKRGVEISLISGLLFIAAFTVPDPAGLILAIVGRVGMGVGFALVIDWWIDPDHPPNWVFVGLVVLGACWVAPG